MTPSPKLPILISNPHAGLHVPPEAAPYCCLSTKDIVEDGDEGASEIYDMAEFVSAYVTTGVARAIVDLNRAKDDFRPDGVIKTHTCWNVPVYSEFPPQRVTGLLLDSYYFPYHEKLTRLAPGVRMGVDCHTMAAAAPPIEDEPGKERPWVCLSDLNGKSLPSGWMEVLADCFAGQFDGHVNVNDPFQGGYITQSHSSEIPWFQLELTRAPVFTNQQKKEKAADALKQFCLKMFPE